MTVSITPDTIQSLNTEVKPRVSDEGIRQAVRTLLMELGEDPV